MTASPRITGVEGTRPAYDFVIADVFTDRVFGGNQLAVLPDARGLTSNQMQAIAREFNFAESTFVLPAEQPGSTARVRIFSPKAEMPFAGHPTVGTGAVLTRLGLVPVVDGIARLVLEEQVGPVVVTVTVGPGECLHSELTLVAELEAPQTSPDPGLLAAALSLPASSVRETWFGSVGVRFCFCRLDSESAVDRAAINTAAWPAALDGAWANHVFLYAGDIADGADLYARMFAPDIGISEDPATGSACAVLAARLGSTFSAPEGSPAMRIRQGFAMGRPSRIRASARVACGRVADVTVGGSVVVFASGSIDLAGDAEQP